MAENKPVVKGVQWWGKVSIIVSDFDVEIYHKGV